MIKKFLFGKTREGKEVYGYKLDNKKGLCVTVLEYGAILNRLVVKDESREVDMVLGYDSLLGYEDDPYFFGCIVGRCANRTKDGSFVLNGKEYHLDKNDNGKNNLHSGRDFFNKRIWTSFSDGNKVVFSLTSPDMDQGFPGNMEIRVSYELLDCSLVVTIEAQSDKDSICNITNHTYWNLNGEDRQDILGHILEIPSGYITSVDEELISDGGLFPVAGTAFDFKSPKAIGRDIEKNEELLLRGAGYDHNYCIEGSGKRAFARLLGDESNIELTLKSSLPGFQLYTGNYLGTEGEHPGKGGHKYEKRYGVALEPQYIPNAINISGFKAPIIRANEKVSEVIEYCLKY